VAVFPKEINRWTRAAGEALATARATPADLDAYRADVESGQAQLWEIPGDPVSYVLTRVEQDTAGNLELVIVAGAGQNAAETIEWFNELASKAGIPSIRAHINRPGLARIFERQGYTLDEWVMRTRTDGQ